MDKDFSFFLELSIEDTSNDFDRILTFQKFTEDLRSSSESRATKLNPSFEVSRKRKKIESHLLDGSKMEDRLRSARVSFLFIYIREEARGVRGEGFVGWQIRAGAEKGACKNRK